MEFPVNIGLIKNPLNWITILLMVTLGGFVVDALLAWRKR